MPHCGLNFNKESHMVRFTILLFIISTGIIILPTFVFADSDLNIPSWIKTNAGFWVDDKIDDLTFLRSIEYLAQNGIIQVAPNEKNIIESLESEIYTLNITLHEQIEKNTQHIQNEKVLQQQMGILQTQAKLNIPDFEDNGDFIIRYDRSGDLLFKTISFQYDIHKDFVDWYNQNFKLPYDIEVRLTGCNFNATHSYNSELHKIIICTNYDRKIAEFFLNTYPYNYPVEDQFSNTVIVMFARQIGHALIDAYDIPLTSNIEESMNSLLHHNMIEWTEDSWGQEALHDTITKYYLVHYDSTSKTHPNYANSLNIQRALSMACALYGANSTYTDLEKWIHKDKIKTCASEYEQQTQHWERIFAPYRKIQYVP